MTVKDVVIRYQKALLEPLKLFRPNAGLAASRCYRAEFAIRENQKIK